MSVRMGIDSESFSSLRCMDRLRVILTVSAGAGDCDSESKTNQKLDCELTVKFRF